MAKASDENVSDGQGRKLGERSGLDIGCLGESSNARSHTLLCIAVFGIVPTNDPSSPSRKRCELDVAYSSRMRGVGVKMLSSPPGEYGRKAET